MTGDVDDTSDCIVVTGGSRGIGRAVVLAAAADGARVAFCARTLGPAADAVVAEAEQLTGPGRVLAVRADVSRECDVEALFDKVIDRFGRVDAVVSNAGINRDALLVQTSTVDFDAVVATNLTGAFLVCRRAVQEFLAEGDGGRIVCIGSVSQYGATSQAAYAAAKGGLGGLTRSIAKEYGHKGVRANLVVVGYVDTDLTADIDPALRKVVADATALRRTAHPDEIADVVRFLVSPRSSYVNGAAVHAGGGLQEVPR